MISVVMPNYNHACYLWERITSLLDQLPEDGEMIIVDDCSTDDSFSILQSIAEKDSRVQLFRNEQNCGVVDTVMRGVSLASGTYLYLASADDLILPGYLQKSLQALCDHPHLSVCCADNGVFESDPSEFQPNNMMPDVETIRAVSPKEVIKAIQRNRFSLSGTSIMIKRETFLKFGGYRKELGPACDLILNESIIFSEGFVYIPEVLTLWRNDAKGFSGSTKTDLDAQWRMYTAALNFLSEPGNKRLRHLFCKAGALHWWTDLFFWRIVMQPKSYDVLFSTMKMYTRRRFRRHFKSLTKRVKRWRSRSQLQDREGRATS